MDAVNGEAKSGNQLPDLDTLDNESLKALVLATHTSAVGTQRRVGDICDFSPINRE